MENDVIIDSFNNLFQAGYKLPQITIYKSPSDYPGIFIARLWDIAAGKPLRTPFVVVRETLEDIRETIPEYMSMITRQPQDDPVIVETWL